LLGCKELLYERLHFRAVQDTARPDGLLSGHAAYQFFPAGEFHIAGEVFELFQQQFEDGLFITLTRICRCAMYDKAVLAKRFYLIAQDEQVGRQFLEQDSVGCGQLKGDGEQAFLTGDGLFFGGGGLALVEDPFMSRLLVYKDESPVGGGDDIGVELLLEGSSFDGLELTGGRAWHAGDSGGFFGHGGPGYGGAQDGGGFGETGEVGVRMTGGVGV